MACLPDELDLDSVCDYLKYKRPRLWIELRQIEIEMQTHTDADRARWTLAIWAHRLRVRSVKQLEKDLAELRSLGVIEPDEVRTCYHRAVDPGGDGGRGAGAQDSPRPTPGSSPRPRYPSDERRLRTTPQTTPQDSAESLAESPQSSAEAPQPLPDSGTGTGPVPERNINISTPDSGNRTGTGGTPHALRIGPPITTAERLVAEGMVRVKAEERIVEFGEARWQEALEALNYARRNSKKPPAEGNGAGWLFDFVRNNRPLPKAMIEARERAAVAAAQGRLNLPVMASGGAPRANPPPQTSVQTPPDAARQEQEELRQFRREQFLMGLPPDEQVAIEKQVRETLPPVHSVRWAEGQPPPLACRALVEARRAEIIDTLMADGERRSA